MSFNYNKTKNRDDGNVQWTSYSDLFMSLSVIFLLLYVTSSLRQGTSAIQQRIETQKLAQENSDLKQQIKVYNTLKEDYLNTGASRDEQHVYQELMGKLDMLKGEASVEKNELRQKALENEKKEEALNQYQKLVRNIINSNLVAQARLKRRDLIIEQKDDIISQKHDEIKGLENEVKEKKRIIVQGERTITSINEELNSNVAELKKAYQNQEISEKKLNEETARIKQETAERIENLKQKNSAISQQLVNASEKLVTVNTQLETAKGTIQKQDIERSKLQKEVEQASAKYGAQIDSLKRDYEITRAKDKGDFDRELKKHKLSAVARAEREAEYKAESARKADDLNRRIASLNSKITDTEAQLKKAKELADARKVLAHDIKRNFEAGGIRAEVDENTGDVTLDFGSNYFDTGRADLKSGMRQILERAMPLYSMSLLGNKKIGQKVNSVEIVGFASPTYMGKYVDPQSLNQQDRKAVDFNLDLSFNRARSIFKYVFDTNKMTFRYQRELLPLVKVTGRSYLAESKNSRDVASGTRQEEFCSRHDCLKAQKVIIKFTLED